MIHWFPVGIENGKLPEELRNTCSFFQGAQVGSKSKAAMVALFPDPIHIERKMATSGRIFGHLFSTHHTAPLHFFSTLVQHDSLKQPSFFRLTAAHVAGCNRMARCFSRCCCDDCRPCGPGTVWRGSWPQRP